MTTRTICNKDGCENDASAFSLSYPLQCPPHLGSCHRSDCFSQSISSFSCVKHQRSRSRDVPKSSPQRIVSNTRCANTPVKRLSGSSIPDMVTDSKRICINKSWESNLKADHLFDDNCSDQLGGGGSSLADPASTGDVDMESQSFETSFNAIENADRVTPITVHGRLKAITDSLFASGEGNKVLEKDLDYLFEAININIDEVLRVEDSSKTISSSTLTQKFI